MIDQISNLYRPNVVCWLSGGIFLALLSYEPKSHQLVGDVVVARVK